jgi:TonB family protein
MGFACRYINMTPESLKLRFFHFIGRVRNDYWPRLRQDIATREPLSLFFRALLVGFLLSVPFQCTRMAYNAIFSGDETEAVDKDQPLNAPNAVSAVTGMPNPKARRPASPIPTAPKVESAAAPIEDQAQSTEQSPAAGPDQEAHVVERKALDYPVESLRKGETGSVTIRVRIDAEGNPSDARVEQSSGFRNLDRAARQAVMRWSYAPKIVNSIAVESEILVPVDFKLDN